MQVILEWLPLLNFAVVWVLKPLWDNQKALKATIANQQKEIEELTKINKQLSEEVRLLKELVFKNIPAEQLQEHVLCHLNENCKG